MPYNGNGIFNLTYDWEQDKANGIKIRADRMMGQEQDIADGMSIVMTLDGQSTPTADLPMGGFNFTGVGDATARDEFLTAGQLEDGSLISYTATGTDTYAVTTSPSAPAYAAYQVLRVLFTNANTGAATLNRDTLGAKAITKNGTSALESGDIPAGSIKELVYDGTRYQIVGDGGMTAQSEDFLAVIGKVTATITNSSTPMTAKRRYSFTGTGPAVLPTMVAGDYVYVEYAQTAGVTGTTGRNSQTIDGAAADDTYIGDGSNGPVVRYECVSAGVVTSRLCEGIPV